MQPSVCAKICAASLAHLTALCIHDFIEEMKKNVLLGWCKLHKNQSRFLHATFAKRLGLFKLLVRLLRGLARWFMLLHLASNADLTSDPWTEIKLYWRTRTLVNLYCFTRDTFMLRSLFQFNASTRHRWPRWPSNCISVYEENTREGARKRRILRTRQATYAGNVGLGESIALIKETK